MRNTTVKENSNNVYIDKSYCNFNRKDIIAYRRNKAIGINDTIISNY